MIQSLQKLHTFTSTPGAGFISLSREEAEAIVREEAELRGTVERLTGKLERWRDGIDATFKGGAEPVHFEGKWRTISTDRSLVTFEACAEALPELPSGPVVVMVTPIRGISKWNELLTERPD